MDTLTIVREIIDLATERDALHNRLLVANDEIAAYQADSLRQQSRANTQASLIDELRACVEDHRTAIERLRAELDAARLPPASQIEPAIMTREQILSIAREALSTGRQVRAIFINPGTHRRDVCRVSEIDDSSIPIRLDRGWCHLACEIHSDDLARNEGLASLELL